MIKRVDENGNVRLITNIRKPRKWRRYEYLLSDGNAYIDTKVLYDSTKSSYKIECKFSLPSNVGSYDAIFGAYTDENSKTLRIIRGNNNSIMWSYYNTRAAGGVCGRIETANSNIREVVLTSTTTIVTENGTTTTYTHPAVSGNDTTSVFYLFCQGTSSGAISCKSKSRIYYFKLYDNDTLIRDLVPAEYNGLYGMWDLVEDKFYGNSGTGSFTVGPEIKNYDEIYEVKKAYSILPSGVELYDYIEGNGTSTYLDTGVNPQVKPRVVADLTFVNSADKDYWGNSAIAGSAYYADFYQCLLKYYRFGSTVSIDCGNAVSVNTRHIYDVSDNVYLDGTLIKTTTNTYTYNSSQSTILIFKAARSNYYSNYKLHDFELYDGDTLVRHLLPCTYLGEPGMWDTVENKFYRNQGTGQFTLGNKITLKLYEYLATNDVNQYIATNVYLNDGHIGEYDMIFKYDATSTRRITGGTNGKWSAYFGAHTDNTYGIVTSGSNYPIGNIDHLREYFDLVNYRVGGYLNGVLYWDKPARALDAGYMDIFALLAKAYGGGQYFYSGKLLIDNQIVRDFIPVSYNGTPGLWDKVEWKFYANAGSGSFTLGPEKASGIYPVTEGSAYGVQWTENLSSTTLLRIGSYNLHRELPILSQFKGCVVNPFTKQVIYWLDENDWSKKADGTSSVLDGTDGLVMVHIPRFWGKSGKAGTTCWVKISPRYIDSTWQEIPEMFVGAYRATVSNSKAYSVVNTTAAFRGGDNRSAYDTYLNSDPFRSDLGKPRTNLSRANMRTYCRNNGMEMLNYEYYKWIFYWCYVIEYANFNCLAAFNSMLTNDGFRLGGLGSGVTTWSNTATSWSGYNATYPITPNGYCNSIGNGTGTKALTIPLTVNGSNTIASKTFYVPRWRGFDNPFGDTWTNLDGCNVQGDTEGNPKNIYTTTDPSKYGDNTTAISNMTLAGHIIHKDGCVKEFDLGSTGNIFASSVGGSSTTYKCDYNYTGSKNTSLRLLLVGGGVDRGGTAGLSSLLSSVEVGTERSSGGFRPIVVV